MKCVALEPAKGHHIKPSIALSEWLASTDVAISFHEAYERRGSTFVLVKPVRPASRQHSVVLLRFNPECLQPLIESLSCHEHASALRYFFAAVDDPADIVGNMVQHGAWPSTDVWFTPNERVPDHVAQYESLDELLNARLVTYKDGDGDDMWFQFTEHGVASLQVAHRVTETRKVFEIKSGVAVADMTGRMSPMLRDQRLCPRSPPSLWHTAL